MLYVNKYYEKGKKWDKKDNRLLYDFPEVNSMHLKNRNFTGT